jgi:hypothetical protein
VEPSQRRIGGKSWSLAARQISPSRICLSLAVVPILLSFCVFACTSPEERYWRRPALEHVIHVSARIERGAAVVEVTNMSPAPLEQMLAVLGGLNDHEGGSDIKFRLGAVETKQITTVDPTRPHTLILGCIGYRLAGYRIVGNADGSVVVLPSDAADEWAHFDQQVNADSNRRWWSEIIIVATLIAVLVWLLWGFVKELQSKRAR